MARFGPTQTEASVWRPETHSSVSDHLKRKRDMLRFKREINGRTVFIDENGVAWDAPKGGNIVDLSSPPPTTVREPARHDLIMKNQISSDDTVESLINGAVRNKKLITWAAMHQVMYPGIRFQSTNVRPMIDAAFEERDGADALLVDADGRYSATAPSDRHLRWLAKNEFGLAPRVR